MTEVLYYAIPFFEVQCGLRLAEIQTHHLKSYITWLSRQENDTNPAMGGDQDDILPTGSMLSCFANGPGTADAYDMSGNVKEWRAARAAGQNPLRGGASNSTVTGTACELNFTLANDSFFFPNVGFRCCR